MPRRTVEERLLHRSERRGECRVWLGYCDEKGYGRILVDRKSRPVHRVAYETWRGPIPEGLVIDHLCRNRSCLEPSHLEPVTNRENILRGKAQAAINARKTHCVNGHELSPENVYPGRGSRDCRKCINRRTTEWKRRKRAKARMMEEVAS